MEQSQRLMEIAKSFMKAGRMHRMCCDKLISGIKMHRGQHMLLMELSRCQGKASQKELAEKLEISPAAVAVMIKKLEHGGFILKKTSRGDNRYNEISITEKGKDTVEKTRQYFASKDRAMFCGITDEELSIMERCFEKMTENLKKTIEEES